MPDNNTAVSEPQSETPNGTDPQSETLNNKPTGEMPEGDSKTSSIEELTAQLEKMQAALKKANNEAASNRKAAKELEDLRKKAEDEKLSESEKLQKQLAALQAERDHATQTAQEIRVSSAIQLEAMQQGIDAKLASKLIDRAEVELDEQGTVTNVSELLKALIKQYPNLVNKQQAPTSGGATNPSRSTTSGTSQVNEQFVRDVLSGKLPTDTYGKLTPEQRIQFLTVQQTLSRR